MKDAGYGDEDVLLVGPELFDFPEEFDAVEAWHLDVGDDQVEGAGTVEIETVEESIGIFPLTHTSDTGGPDDDRH